MEEQNDREEPDEMTEHTGIPSEPHSPRQGQGARLTLGGMRVGPRKGAAETHRLAPGGMWTHGTPPENRRDGASPSAQSEDDREDDTDEETAIS